MIHVTNSSRQPELLCGAFSGVSKTVLFVLKDSGPVGKTHGNSTVWAGSLEMCGLGGFRGEAASPALKERCQEAFRGLSEVRLRIRSSTRQWAAGTEKESVIG